jgi:hypothetical protein
MLIGLSLVMAADGNRYFPVQPFQKIEQLVGCEAAEMPVHQMRHVRLCNAQNTANFTLFQLFLFSGS